MSELDFWCSSCYYDLSYFSFCAIYQGDRIEMRRFAAVLVIKELAISAPTLIYTSIPQILDLLWVALRDPKVFGLPPSPPPTHNRLKF